HIYSPHDGAFRKLQKPNHFAVAMTAVPPAIWTECANRLSLITAGGKFGLIPRNAPKSGRAIPARTCKTTSARFEGQIHDRVIVPFPFAGLSPRLNLPCVNPAALAPDSEGLAIVAPCPCADNAMLRNFANKIACLHFSHLDVRAAGRCRDKIGALRLNQKLRPG